MRERTRAREYALQILYQIEITNDPVDVVLNRFWEHTKYTPPIREFATQIVRGTVENLAEINALIEKYSKHWNLERMPAIDRSILHSAIYELIYTNDAPSKVIINEAVDIAKTFSTSDSGKFINGILDKVLTHRPESWIDL